VGDSGASQSVGRPHSHLCWVFDDHADFRAAAVEFLADGLARGCRVRYIAAGDEETLRAELAPLERLEQARRPGAVEVLPVSVTYAGTERCVDARTQVELYDADTRSAVADGFTGLRVAADATMLVRTPAQLDAFARYEHQVDRYITLAPFSALCGYRRSELGDDTVAQLACLHPGGSAEQAPFRMHATPDADLALSGELDLTTVDLFAAAVDRAGLDDRGSEIVVDATGLDFADHRNLLVLERMADRYGRSVVLRTARHWPERLVAALGLTRVRVEHQGI
jgi:anti-anti-sigma regulatory factor